MIFSKFNAPLATVCLMLTCGLMASAAESPREIREQQDELRPRVTKVLHGEQLGVTKDRKRALQSVLDAPHPPEEAYWQAGYVRVGDRWVNSETSWLTTQDEARLKDYTEMREILFVTDEDHLRVAEWCENHGYPEQKRAHLKALLLKYPDHVGLRQALGYQRIGNRWMNEAEYNQMVENAKLLEAKLEEWVPKLETIRDGLVSRDTSKRTRAKIQLEQISTTDAVPAIEMVLLAHSEQTAAAGVSQLCAIKHRDATLSLCRAAMFLTSPTTKEQAIAELKTRPLEEYVPDLLSQTSAPMNHSVDLFFSPRTSTLTLQTISTGESYAVNKQYLKRFNIHFQPVRVVGVVGDFDSAQDLPALVLESNLRLGQEEVGRLVLDSAAKNAKQIEQLEQDQQQRNNSITNLLLSVTDVQEEPSPSVFWEWWQNQQDTSLSSKQNQIQEVSETDEISEFEPILLFEHSCFVAGTPVTTLHGQQAIETIKVGDQVLTKNSETGELTYKNVIRTTVRDPKPLVQIKLNGEEINATRSHPFWVSGSGWIKARDLKPGMQLHTPTGTVGVVSVAEAKPETTYNLVVEDFHSYFVGNSQALCHDISMTEHTDAVVPGLIEKP